MASIAVDRKLVARIAHDLSLGALVGGNLFGQLAMGPALADISDKAQRGQVLNRAWRRYGTVNSLALAALVGSWLPGRVSSSTRSRKRPRGRLGIAEDVAYGAVVLTGLATAAGGVGFAQQAPSGAVPIESGHQPAPETPSGAATLKRVVNVLGVMNLACELALAVISAAAACGDGTSA